MVYNVNVNVLQKWNEVEIRYFKNRLQRLLTIDFEYSALQFYRQIILQSIAVMRKHLTLEKYLNSKDVCKNGYHSWPS